MSNSLDPWRVMQAGTYVTDMVVPESRFGHPFYGYGYPQGWASNSSRGSWQGDVFVGADVGVGVGSWLDDVGNAIGSALSALKPVITTAAKAVATEYGGPEAGAAAGALAGPITDTAANALNPKKKSKVSPASKQVVAQARQAARTNPAVAQALDATQNAVAHATTLTIAQHVTNTIQKAAQGDPAAQQHVDQILQAAQQGDPAAHMALSLAQQFVASSSPPSDAPAVSGFFGDVWNGILTVTGTKLTNQFIHDNHLEGVVQVAAGTVASIYGGPAAGAAASALAPSVMSLGVKDKKKAAAAKKHVNKVTAAAQQHSPQMAHAVNVAKDAIGKVATAYHVAAAAHQASSGDPTASQQVAHLATAAVQGNQDAQQLIDAAHDVAGDQFDTSSLTNAVSDASAGT